MLPHAGSDVVPVAGLCHHGEVDAWGSFAHGPPKPTGEGEPGYVERLLQSGGGCMWLAVPVLLALLQHPLAWLVCSAVVARGIQGVALVRCDPAVGDRACAWGRLAPQRA